MPSTKGITPARPALPNLEEFRAETDPDGFYSEAELLELHASTVPVDPGHHEKKRRLRRQRMRERQAAPLTRLEATLAEFPDPAHALDTWLEPALGKRLAAAGLLTLADLLGLIERYRWRWYAQVPRIGRKTAARVSTWLAANAQSLHHEISVLALMPRRKIPADHPTLVHSIQHDLRGDAIDVSTIAAMQIEALRSPPELDGKTGTHRAPHSDNRLAVTADLAAITSGVGLVQGTHIPAGLTGVKLNGLSWGH